MHTGISLEGARCALEKAQSDLQLR